MDRKSRVDVDEQNGILQIRLNLFFVYFDQGWTTGVARAKAGINIKAHKRLMELSSEYRKYDGHRINGRGKNQMNKVIDEIINQKIEKTIKE